MEKRKSYYGTHFSIDIIIKAHDLFLLKAKNPKKNSPTNLTIYIGDEMWKLDTREEFLSEYLKADEFWFDHISDKNRIIIEGDRNHVSVLVGLPSAAEIQEVFLMFETNLSASKMIISPDPVKIFIGHGHDQQWRDLKDHLHEQQGFDVVTYEIGPRAGLSVKEVLEGMLGESSFALLVLTGEDQDVDGKMHARGNVIHELGLFQGRLGFLRAIALLERGVEEFSNILGINQIRFSKGNIRESYGDVLAAIKREFKKNKEGRPQRKGE